MSRLSAPFHVGPYLVEPALNRIIGPDSTVRVEPKVMEVLVELASRAGAVVTREELFETVWQGTVVSDDALTRSISELRKSFGDDPRSPAFIETIPKTGYRLIAPIMFDTRGDNVPGHQPFIEMRPGSTTRRPDRHRDAARWGVVLAIGLGIAFVLLRPQPDSGLVDQIHYAPRPLTSYPGSESNPKLSPDGRQVAFAWSQDGNSDVYVKLIEREPPLRLTDADAFDVRPIWSPDGSQLAFVRYDDQCTLQVVSALGGPTQEIAPCGATIYPDPDWSPEGDWIALNNREADDEPFSIVLLSPDGRERTRLSNPPSGIWGDHDPSFSPDGKHLAFTRSASEGIQDLFVVNLETGVERRLTADSRNIWGHDWLDASSLVFSSNRTGRPALWSISIDGDPPVRLSVAVDAAQFPSVSGAAIAFAYARENVGIRRVGPGDPAASPILESSGWDMHPHLSHDGSRIAFTSNRSGSYEIWIANADGSDLQKVTDFGGPFTSSPRWSPDGSTIAFTGRDRGNADIYLLEANTSARLPLVSSDADELAPSWHPDGSSVLYSSNTTGRWEVYRIGRDGTTPEQLTIDGGIGGQMANDGTLYYAKPAEMGIWHSTPTLREERIVDDLDTRDWGSWRLANRRLVYLRRGRPSIILAKNLETGEVDTLFVPDGPVPGGDPALDVSSDGSVILFGQVDEVQRDLLMVDLQR